MTEISEVAKETVYVLKYFNPMFISKIPASVLKGLRELAQKSSFDVRCNIDGNKKLSEQDISEETKDLISLIYYSYIATEEEKKQMIEVWNKNELSYQKEMSEKYNLDKIFKRNNIGIDNRMKDEELENAELRIDDKKNLPIKINENNIFKKILKFIVEFVKKIKK